VTRPFRLRDAEPLEQVRSWAFNKADGFRDGGYTLELNDSPEDRNPRSIQVILDGGARVGELIVWGNGMAELSYGNFDEGVITPEHRDIDSQADLDAALTALLAWMST
jgi:hypothetical protein